MKIVQYCVACKSTDLAKKIGVVQPFISHLVLDYPLGSININGGQGMDPVMFTNAIYCRSCEFVFSQVRYDDDELAKIYKGYRGEEYARLRDKFEPGYYKLNAMIGKFPAEVENRAAAMADFLAGEVDSAKMGSVLDFGGDKGQHIPALFSGAKRYVYEISGVDVIEGVTLVKDLDEARAMDFVICSNVLEHIPYPAGVLAQLKKAGAPGTWYFIDVPFERLGNDYPIYFHEHINYFNEKSLAKLLETEGFRVQKMKTYTIDMGWITGRSIYALAQAV